MEKKLIEEITTADGKLTYCLFCVNDSYGIKVDCDLFDEKQTITVENITANYALAHEIFYKLADFSALPANAADIIEDSVCDFYLVL